MRLMKWYPETTGLRTARSEMDDLFNNLFLFNRRRLDSDYRGWTPRVDIQEHENDFEISAEIPGMDKDEISIEVQENILTIRGEKKTEEKVAENNYHLCERSTGSFERSFTLPDNTDPEGVDAEYKNGVLKITVPKTIKAQPKEIKVNIK
ncbi:MAG: Hsp20/alpha crystallin family protein [Candidatus Krumholzibacteria bacterium]|nr:Hsp20/alpha crystallin family protein [Candidatus Krumholzibacteria bacterium]